MNPRPLKSLDSSLSSSSSLATMQLWWWPSFVFLYPLLFSSLGQQSRTDIIVYKYFFGLLALVGGALLEWSYRTPALGQIKVSSKRAALFDFNSVSILAFGLWSLTACLTAPEPVVALTGSIYDKNDAAIWLFTLTLSAWLIYLQGKRYTIVLIRVFYATVLAGGIIAVSALVEIFIGHGLIYKVTQEVLPMVTFPQKGHLAGFFVLCFGVSLVAWQWKNRLIYACALLCCIGVGLCFNRASLLGMLLAILVCLVLNWRKYWIISILSIGCVGLGLGMVQVFNVQSTRDLATSGTVSTRSYLWKAGLNGIAERPWAGWGGGYFQRVWTRQLTLKDLKAYMKLEFGVNLVKVDDELLVSRSADGTIRAAPFAVWKSHNQFIEVALLYGIPGLLLYLLILFRLFRAGGLRNPAVIGIFAYHVFFMLWFSIPESDGVMWALIGAGMAGLPSARAPESQILEPSPPTLSSN